MSSIKVNCGNIEISNDNKICIIAGPCQLETEQHAIDMAGKIKEIAKKFKDAGATIIGGCCETTPSHIEAMAKIK